jgi:hypothetical protein
MRLRYKFLIIVSLLPWTGCLCCQPKNQSQRGTESDLTSQDRPKSVLSIETGLVYKSGDAKPVARNEFYLLEEDAEKILREAKVEKKGRLKKL